jgi:hypothetical protein
MRNLDNSTIRIKGTDVVTKVRFCSADDDGVTRVVTEMSCVHENDSDYPGAAQFVCEDNPYADFFKLDQIEVSDGKGGWHSPNFKVKD